MTLETRGRVRAFRRPWRLTLLLSIFQTLGVFCVPAFSQTRVRITGIEARDERVVYAATPLNILTPINQWGGLSSLSDEHSTVFPPGTFKDYPNDYLFFVASKTALQTMLQDDLTGGNDRGESGLVVLRSPGPDSLGYWYLDFAPTYGVYPPSQNNPSGETNAQVFLSAMDHHVCPSASETILQDQTFDLNYAAPGSVLIDPTVGTSNGSEKDGMLAVYEGANKCVGILGGASSKIFYSTIAIATSGDQGLRWPAYRSNPPSFTPPLLPEQDPTAGPNAPNGASGEGVCFGNDCEVSPPSTYGRFPVLNTPVTIAVADETGSPLGANTGDGEPSAFIDDVSLFNTGLPYLYIIHGYAPGPIDLGIPYSDPRGRGNLTIARAQLNGGVEPLKFIKWFGTSVSYPTTSGSFDLTLVPFQCPPGQECPAPMSNAGLSTDGPAGIGGGLESPIFPTTDATSSNTPQVYQTCQASTQGQQNASISYVPDTQEYVLTFVCLFPANIGPTGAPANDPQGGAAWFFSTLDATQYDLSRQDKWSPPQMIKGSWREFSQSAPCAFDGWYPSFMSQGRQPGRLSLEGFVFSMDGCLDEFAGKPRQYRSRRFKIFTE